MFVIVVVDTDGSFLCQQVFGIVNEWPTDNDNQTPFNSVNRPRKPIIFIIGIMNLEFKMSYFIKVYLYKSKAFSEASRYSFATNGYLVIICMGGMCSAI